MLIVTHRIAELIRITDRATVMRDGRDVGVLERSEITEKNLLALMTGKTETGPRCARRPRGRPATTRGHEGSRACRCGPSGRPSISISGAARSSASPASTGRARTNSCACSRASSRRRRGCRRCARPRWRLASPVRDLADADQDRVAYVSGDRKREGIFASHLASSRTWCMPLYREKRRAGILGDHRLADAVDDLQASRSTT